MSYKDGDNASYKVIGFVYFLLIPADEGFMLVFWYCLLGHDAIFQKGSF